MAVKKRCVPTRCIKKSCKGTKSKRRGACRAAKGNAPCLKYKTCHGKRVCAQRDRSSRYGKADTPYLRRLRALRADDGSRHLPAGMDGYRRRRR